MAVGRRPTAKSSWPATCLLVVLAVAGCGSGSASPSSGSSAPDRYFGDHPGQEATRAHLSRRDCDRLAASIERSPGTVLRVRAEPSPPNSRCQASGAGADVSIYLDAAFAARQRYLNRMVEQIQFNAPDPARIPHNLPGVGDRSAGNQYASWIPAYSTLYAVRGNRWVTVAYAVRSSRPAQRKAAAVALTRRTFKLTAR